MTKTKVREVTIKETSGNFIFLKGKEEYDFDGLSALRKILSKEKARLLDAIKYKEPGSIYEVAKILKRPFKAVFDDIKLLERMGFIEIKEVEVKGRTRHKPIIVVDEVIVHLKI
ncbi:MAG: ArsR family transcriptional regulator [Nanoarchaeota archaeon]|nr:ArsR family transcriptional regulator [Nanoarchaeota archaeon]